MNANAHDEQLERVRRECTTFPDVSERPSHGSPAYFVGEKKNFVMFVDDQVADAELGAILEDAYRCVAPKKLVAEFDGSTKSPANQLAN